MTTQQARGPAHVPRTSAPLAGRSIVVTGAASGIGATTVRRLRDDGAAVTALDIDPVVLELADPPNVAAAVVDVSRPGELAAAVQEAAEREGGLHGAVAAAGTTRSGTAEATPLEDWNEVLAVNLTTVFLLAKATFPAFRRAGHGALVAVASQFGLVGCPDHVAYCASKGGVVNLVRALALDAAADGIRVNALCPGPIDTPMLRRDLEETGQNLADITARVPAGRVGRPEEIAATAAFLLGDDTKFVTGAVWTVDGGYSTG